jgi:hypothetical protein
VLECPECGEELYKLELLVEHRVHEHGKTLSDQLKEAIEQSEGVSKGTPGDYQ